ncbi:homoserine kinase [Tepidibacter hydrothermalis]|uniref:Homoserine kinase n=1 Tax=Tepidibacter hydrothermalis TaxID=3036126 RepID=A0ABY8EF81_9FIRM|nr:homoserine kinase [Tepidibacter hydrothermalis]WFD09388.1 homoserine kinase [Tepidibacter hydrothermalis]
MINVRIPATTANVGPGFDCLGIALNIYNNFFVEEIEDGLIIEGCDDEYCNEDNLIYKSMKKCFEKIGYKHKGIRIKIENDIPISRGLGSSASCVLAGVIGANKIAGNKLNKNEILKISSEIEGHPDNVAPALLGGMVTSIKEGDDIYCSKINIPKGLKFCALIPDFKLSTEKSRAVLPNEIPYKDGVFNVGRVSLMVSALINGQFDLIKLACKDNLHQKYRGSLIKDYDDIINKCKDLDSVGVFLSGAGPTIMAMIKEDDINFYDRIKEYTSNLENTWTIRELNIDNKGVEI